MSERNSDSTETTQLLEKIRNGVPAFDELFSKHRPALRKAIELRFDPRLRARVDPSDVVQETQLEAFRRLPDYLARQPMPFHLWVRKMAHERLIMARRKHIIASRRAVAHELPLPNESSAMLGHQALASNNTPSQYFSANELASAVRLAMAQLPESDRELLLMRAYERLSYQEIAYILEIEPATARKRNGRALIKLHKLLNERGVSESQL